MSTVKNVDKLDVSKFVADLTAAGTRSGGGAESKWRLNVAKLEENKELIMRQPLQCRVLVKALLLNREQAEQSFTYSKLAEWALAAGLDTRQEPERIVRYYSKPLRNCCIEAVK